jgi:hypothetical protein
MMKFWSFAAFLLLSLSGLISALPTSPVDDYPNMVVLIRHGMDEAFAHSPNMADQVKSEIRSGARAFEQEPEPLTEHSIDSSSNPSLDTLTVLKKRSNISISYCTTSNCTGCATTTSTFSVNFCLNVPGTQCIIIGSLTNAKIRYWNHQQCNGAESTFTGCGRSGDLAAPGTNSIGFQINCT